MTDHILVLDSGTTSTRAIAFDRAGHVAAVAQKALTQHYPQPGWVEHDADEIWRFTLACAQEVADKVGADTIAAIGITNQRETVVAWDRQSGEPLARAIVWQDRRTAGFCAELKQAGHEPLVQRATGLLLDPYFSGTKMRWLLDNDGQVRSAAAAERLALGTVESWLVWKLSEGRDHLTDASNASRTLLLNLDGQQFDEGLCELIGVPRVALPRVVDTQGALSATELLGPRIPITGLAGDQQAATIGQACFAPGDTKSTYGTGAFVLTNMGEAMPRSEHRLLGTVLMQSGGKRTYALEGSVFVAGSLVQWLRDALSVIDSAAETEALARSVPDSGGVTIVPALSGLGAPHWKADARGVIAGLSFSTGRAQIARAALEAMAHQTRDLADAFAADGARWASLKIDGGMSANDWMAQDLANVLEVPVERPDMIETTALGAAMLAAVGAGLFPALEDAAAAMRGRVRRFEPAMDGKERADRLKRWKRALEAI
ncbi:glycerol kinase GlpK [Tsuneonella amylolytica]|uniref:glycerol kinase GlpK n=1 Tax=Tsuneonella amylolytica TaxID=2338327 RepID=UPI000EAA4913|nr:glycerol kinase GlpK [Tsuneonella amylolytica]